MRLTSKAAKREQRRNGDFYENRSVKTTTISFDRESAKELFGLFKHKEARPPLEEGWIVLEGQGAFEQIPEETLEKIYVVGKPEEQRKVNDELFKKFLQGKRQNASVKRITAVFGKQAEQGSKSPYGMKLIYFENLQPLSGFGCLRFHFTYKTIENNVACHLLPHVLYRQRKEKQEEKQRLEQSANPEREVRGVKRKRKEKKKQSTKEEEEEVQRAKQKIAEMNADHDSKFKFKHELVVEMMKQIELESEERRKKREKEKREKRERKEREKREEEEKREKVIEN